ncbi:MAG: nuclear transport factor 2 family protein [Acidobacteriota bacterium]
MGNLATVQQMYAAFGRGDVPAILEHLDEAVEWEYGGNSTDVPWLQPRHGREGAAAFFASLAELDIHRFEVKTLLEGEGVVVALIDIESTVKATGKKVGEEDEVHLWRFNSEGKVTRFRHRVDTHGHQVAWSG